MIIDIIDCKHKRWAKQLNKEYILWSLSQNKSLKLFSKQHKTCELVWCLKKIKFHLIFIFKKRYIEEEVKFVKNLPKHFYTKCDVLFTHLVTKFKLFKVLSFVSCLRIKMSCSSKWMSLGFTSFNDRFNMKEEIFEM